MIYCESESTESQRSNREKNNQKYRDKNQEEQRNNIVEGEKMYSAKSSSHSSPEESSKIHNQKGGLYENDVSESGVMLDSGDDMSQVNVDSGNEEELLDQQSRIEEEQESEIHVIQPSEIDFTHSQQTQSNKPIQQNTSYNDTLDYLIDALGNTYLENLGKSVQDLPPPIQSSSYNQVIKTDSKQFSKKGPSNNDNDRQSIKNLSVKQTDKHKISQNHKFDKVNLQTKTYQNHYNQNIIKDDKIDNILINKDKKNSYPQSSVGSSQSSKLSNGHQNDRKKTDKVKKHQKQTKDQKVIDNFLHGNKFLEDELNQKTVKQHKKDRKHRDYQQQYNPYQQHRGNKLNRPKQVNGWYYPPSDRGNVYYDAKIRPWVIESHRTEEDRYYQEMMKRQYITPYEKEALETYLLRMSTLLPPPYIAPFGGMQEIPYYYNQHYPQYQQFQQPYSFLSQHNMNPYQQNTYLPKSVSIRSETQSQINNFLHSHSQSVQEKSIGSKTIQKNQQKVVGKEKVHQSQEQVKKEIKMPVQKKKVVMPTYEKILPQGILEPPIKQLNTSPPVALIKQMSKPDNKSQVFVIYDVPIIVSNENISTLSADIFLLPYCKAMIVQKNRTKWLSYIQKVTGINILQKLEQMEKKEVQMKGRQILEGSLNRIKMSQKGAKLNFNTLYLVKLTTLIDETSKVPYGRRLFKEMIGKVIESLMNGGSLNESSQKSLLIHGGFFPGIRREDTPRLLSHYLSIALGNGSLEYGRVNPSKKPKKIIINISKQEEYEVYTREMRKIMLEYRKLQSI